MPYVDGGKGFLSDEQIPAASDQNRILELEEQIVTLQVIKDLLINQYTYI